MFVITSNHHFPKSIASSLGPCGWIHSSLQHVTRPSSVFLVRPQKLETSYCLLSKIMLARTKPSRSLTKDPSWIFQRRQQLRSLRLLLRWAHLSLSEGRQRKKLQPQSSINRSEVEVLHSFPAKLQALNSSFEIGHLPYPLKLSIFRALKLNPTQKNRRSIGEHHKAATPPRPFRSSRRSMSSVRSTTKRRDSWKV